MMSVLAGTHEKIGKNIQKAFPQDVMGPHEPIMVRVGDISGRVLEVITIDEAIERHIATGRATHSTSWVVPYCMDCAEPILDQGMGVCCPECSASMAGIL